MDRNPATEAQAQRPTARVRGASAPRPSPEAYGAGASTDTEGAIGRGGQAVEAEGNDLRRASSGNLEGADEESAQQRLRDCQSTLVGLGYHLGHGDDPADGITGSFEATTGEAVRQYQEDNDLEVTGKIDRDTYEALMHSFEQAMEMRAGGQPADSFAYLHAEQPMNGASPAMDAVAAEGPLDDSDATLLELQDELDAGTAPPELEDL